MRKIISFALAAGAASIALLSARPARAADVVVVGGTPETGYETHPTVVGNVHPGPEAEANIGTALSGGYGMGFGGRLGYTLSNGIYLGGDVEHFTGSSDITGAGAGPKNTFVGGEVGLKLFPAYHFEVRPYAFGGADLRSDGTRAFAIQPGVLAAYHFGQAYVDGEARYFAQPGPTALALMVGAGLSF